MGKSIEIVNMNSIVCVDKIFDNREQPLKQDSNVDKSVFEISIQQTDYRKCRLDSKSYTKSVKT